jgi:hypothetical protein
MLTACGSSGPASLAVPGYAYSVKRGETLHMIDDFSIEFTGVVSDGRCPKSVTCVWGGDAVIQLTAKAGEKSAVLDLHSSGTQIEPGKYGNMTAFEGWSIELRELEPWPETQDQRKDPTVQYTARLFVDHRHE